ncbi:response regulator transcription factor [Scandinavium goeteborgense]|uniref:Regulatory LuxR family protein n=1 Tax=Scandinavium goeteborgense TaxID=1851514 RepID=A0A4R6DS82_SCAGO|nr:LuxR C-terminal-related transcriptional regulator [Scandinavium goeteborgense]TDN47454.1 regulatory LuxR family protein [Scandinavium goeteborgense]
MLELPKDNKIDVLIISDDSYYVMGIKKIMGEYFGGEVDVNYQVITEKSFYRAMSEPGSTSIVLESPITFAGDYSYKKLVKYIKFKNVALFGMHHKPGEVIKSLSKLDFHARYEIIIPGIDQLLSERQGMIYFYMKRGVSDDNISHMMNISKKTISSHRGHILKKLGYRNRVMMFTNEFNMA